MIIYLLGLLDFLAGLSLFFVSIGFGKAILGVFMVYLLIKALAFITDWSSWVDLFVVFIMGLAMFGYTDNLTYLGIIWLFQKAFRSFF
jgi:hypothetical protein